jgi:hypothetical protein
MIDGGTGVLPCCCDRATTPPVRSKTVFIVNESNLDRATRIFLGLFLLIATTFLFGVWQWIFGVVGMFLLLTGITGFSPLYRLLMVNTLDS